MEAGPDAKRVRVVTPATLLGNLQATEVPLEDDKGLFLAVMARLTVMLHDHASYFLGSDPTALKVRWLDVLYTVGNTYADARDKADKVGNPRPSRVSRAMRMKETTFVKKIIDYLVEAGWSVSTWRDGDWGLAISINVYRPLGTS